MKDVIFCKPSERKYHLVINLEDNSSQERKGLELRKCTQSKIENTETPEIKK